MRALSAITTTTVLLATAASFAVALPGCTSDQTQSPEGIGSVDMTVTLATPPSGPNEQIDTVEVSLFCEGIDPVLGVPRPAQSSPETFTINASTSQGPEPYNTIGLFEKQGLPAGPCHFEFFAVSNTGNTECTGELSVVVNTDSTTSGRSRPGLHPHAAIRRRPQRRHLQPVRRVPADPRHPDDAVHRQSRRRPHRGLRPGRRCT